MVDAIYLCTTSAARKKKKTPNVVLLLEKKQLTGERVGDKRDGTEECGK